MRRHAAQNEHIRKHVDDIIGVEPSLLMQLRDNLFGSGIRPAGRPQTA
jgi:hypothetical protein